MAGEVVAASRSLPDCYPSPKKRGIIRKSRALNSVRDRGVGGSNPLAPTTFLIFPRKSAELSLAGHSVFPFTSRVGNRVAGASNPPQSRNHSRFLVSITHDRSVPLPLRGKVLPFVLPGRG